MTLSVSICYILCWREQAYPSLSVRAAGELKEPFIIGAYETILVTFRTAFLATILVAVLELIGKWAAVRLVAEIVDFVGFQAAFLLAVAVCGNADCLVDWVELAVKDGGHSHANYLADAVEEGAHGYT